MLQIEGNICAWEVVHARSQHSRYAVPPFFTFHPQENSRKICEKSYESLWLYWILQVSFCARSPQVVQAAATMGTAVDEGVEQPSTLRNPPCHVPHQQVPEKSAHSANLMVIQKINLTSHHLKTFHTRNHLGCLWLCAHFSWHPKWFTEHLPPSGLLFVFLCHHLDCGSIFFLWGHVVNQIRELIQIKIPD